MVAIRKMVRKIALKSEISFSKRDVCTIPQQTEFGSKKKSKEKWQETALDKLQHCVGASPGLWGAGKGESVWPSRHPGEPQFGED